MSNSPQPEAKPTEATARGRSESTLGALTGSFLNAVGLSRTARLEAYFLSLQNSDSLEAPKFARKIAELIAPLEYAPGKLDPARWAANEQLRSAHIDAFLSGLSHRDPKVREQLLVALADTNNPKLGTKISAMLEQETSSEVRIAAARALSLSRGEDAARALTKTLFEAGDARVVEAAGKALAYFVNENRSNAIFFQRRETAEWRSYTERKAAGSDALEDLRSRQLSAVYAECRARWMPGAAKFEYEKSSPKEFPLEEGPMSALVEKHRLQLERNHGRLMHGLTERIWRSALAELAETAKQLDGFWSRAHSAESLLEQYENAAGLRRMSWRWETKDVEQLPTAALRGVERAIEALEIEARLQGANRIGRGAA